MEISHHTFSGIDGTHLHYAMVGSGEPLVLLHGWPQSWREWIHIMPALAAQFTVIAPDLRGFGDSAKPSSGYDKQTVAKDIFALIEHLGFKKVNLAGHDIGMMVAYEMAASNPGLIKRLAVLDAALPGFGIEELQDSAKFPQLWHFGFFKAPGVAEALISGREKQFLSDFIRGLSYNPYAVTAEDIQEYADRMGAPGALRASFEHYRAFEIDATNNKRHSKTLLPMPVLAAGGSHSMGTQVGAIMEQLAKKVETVAIENCGHWIPEEQPEKLAAVFIEFFKS